MAGLSLCCVPSIVLVVCHGTASASALIYLQHNWIVLKMTKYVRLPFFKSICWSAWVFLSSFTGLLFSVNGSTELQTEDNFIIAWREQGSPSCCKETHRKHTTTYNEKEIQENSPPDGRSADNQIDRIQLPGELEISKITNGEVKSFSLWTIGKYLLLNTPIHLLLLIRGCVAWAAA